MISTDVSHLLGAFTAAFFAAAINSAAGGGTLVSFPMLIALGLPPLTANATNTVGILPGNFGSIWGFKAELRRVPKQLFGLLLPSLVGGALGALLLRSTPATVFERAVPWLILFATVLFVVQAPIRRHLTQKFPAGRFKNPALVAATALQLTVAIYGGYFGAGMSIPMLTALSIVGMTDMLEMTAMTSLLSLSINSISGLLFTWAGLVYWPYIPVMALGAVAGGYGAAGVARKIGKVWIRRLVILVGMIITCVMFYKLFAGSGGPEATKS